VDVSVLYILSHWSFGCRKKKLKVMNPEKDVGASKDDNVQHYKNQDGSENLMASSLDIITKKTTLQAENTGVSEGKQNTDRYDLKSCT
jgi:hypothetical protein